MFKFTTILISVFSMIQFAQAQTESEVRTEIDNEKSLILSLTAVANDRVSGIKDNMEANELNYGGGFLIEAGINDKVGIETGALFVNRQYDVSAGKLRVVQEVKRLHIPLAARFWMTDYLSIAGGPFIAVKIGDKKTALEFGDIEVASINTSADDDVEYGIDAALTLNFAVNDKSGIFLEGRYSFLLGNEKGEEADQVSALAGLKFDI